MFANLTTIQQIAAMILPLILAVTLHEAAHGYVANRLGDKTALMLGRITLNPIKHIDPIGTILVPILFLVLPTNFIFGWAKPVPVNLMNLKRPRSGMALVALAGPLSNFVMAFLWAGLLKLSQYLLASQVAFAQPLYYMAISGILINLVLMVLNLLPIPPLDGSQILASVLNPRWAYQFQRMGQFGFIIIIALAIFKILPILLIPPLQFFNTVILMLWGMT